MTITIPTLSSSSWKSTLSGILTATLATSAAFLAPPLSTMNLLSAKTVLWLGAFQVIGKIWISLITQDADKLTSTDIQQTNLKMAAAKETK